MHNQILYTASITPFSHDGSKIDLPSLQKLLHLQAASGNGLLIFGSTGESLSISNQEKRLALEFICNLKLNTQLIIGVPSHNLLDALDWINFCNQLPIHGYLLTTPIYTKPGIFGQTQWFESLLNASLLPSILYNIPGRAAIKLHPSTVKNLAQHPRFTAIKDSGGTIESIVDYQLVAPHISIYCGDDHLMPAMAAEGASGLISVASNAWPTAVRNYVQNSLLPHTHPPLNHDTHKIFWKASKALFAASNPIPIKALLKEIGLIPSDTVRLPLSRQDLSSTHDLLALHTFINSNQLYSHAQH